ncbi:MAG: DUF1957 domain-containing protein, partial [Candidatus Omnitrophica bacterium]|nr:DUF1957 domain-containing protein [Candidatus Omnitrophota bacterium]
MWIDFLARKIACDQDYIQMITPIEYLKEYKTNQIAVPADSSWGHKGYFEYWLNDSNNWIYRHLHQASFRMVGLTNRYKDTLKNAKPTSLFHRAINQAARELLLAESSDWPFIMRSGTMVPYAEKRVKTHISRFTRLYNDLMQENVDQNWLAEVEARDNIFKDIDCVKYYMDRKENNHNSKARNFRERV